MIVYTTEKRGALIRWERHLEMIVTGKKADKIVQMGSR